MGFLKHADVKAFNNEHFNVEIYDSAYQVVKDCEERKITSSSFDNMRKKVDDPDWYGVASYQEALDLMETGYQPTVDELKKGIKANLSGQAKRITFHNDVVGYAPIVPLAIMGVPQSMMNSHMKQVKAKVIDVYYDMTATCDKEPKQFIDAGAKLLGAIMELEMQGYRMNVYCVQGYFSPGSGCDLLCVRVKSANQPLDLKRISFPLTHPAFFRVIGFDWYSKVPGGIHRWGYGHNLSRDFNNEHMQNGFKELFGNNAVVFSASQIIKNKDSKDHLKEVIAGADGKKKSDG